MAAIHGDRAGDSAGRGVRPRLFLATEARAMIAVRSRSFGGSVETADPNGLIQHS